MNAKQTRQNGFFSREVQNMEEREVTNTIQNDKFNEKWGVECAMTRTTVMLGKECQGGELGLVLEEKKKGSQLVNQGRERQEMVGLGALHSKGACSTEEPFKQGVMFINPRCQSLK